VVVKKEEEEKHDKKWGRKMLTKKCESLTESLLDDMRLVIHFAD
jgi:hypothetical protein